MKNDIDDILSNMFGRSNTTGKSRVAQDAEAFLQSLSSNSKNLGDAIEQQSAEIAEITQTQTLETQVQETMVELQKKLEEDGVPPAIVHQVATGSAAAPVDLNTAFRQAEACAKSQVIGQDAFLHRLFLGFKRPFVMGTEEGMPASTMVISGKKGTGRHSALNCVVESLSKAEILKAVRPISIDLALYGDSGDTKLFLQDLFAAIESGTETILFEHYDKCHKSMLPMLTDMVLSGKLQLGSRYANQKGMLIDVGTALVPGAISSISCAKKYLVFLSERSPNKLADAMGAAFMNGISDTCVTSSFSSESLCLIGEKELQELAEKVARVLHFTLSWEETLPPYFAGKFTLSEGVHAIADYAGKCYKVLSEHKLESSQEATDCRALLNGNTLQFNLGETVLTVENSAATTAAAVEVKAQMEEIVGLRTVKDYIFSLEENFKVQKLRKQRGMKAEAPSMHMIFTGNPGTGKTTVARLVSRYLKSMGVLTGGQLIEVTRADLVGRFVGHTAPLTRQVIESAIGGVLFVDEAYSLYRGNDDSFGLEAIDTLVKGMEDNREDLLVILAGYSKEMETFLKANSGLVSRFPHVIEFPDYTPTELMEITQLTAKNKGYSVQEACNAPLLQHYQAVQSSHSRTAGNGRMVRNLVENAALNQSKRIIATGSDNFEELTVSDFDLPKGQNGA